MPRMPGSRMSSETRDTLVYLGLLVCVAAVYLGIRAFGDTLVAPPPRHPLDIAVRVAPVHVNDFVHVLLALALVIAAARALGGVFRWIHQPPVIGEIIAGILLGPSFLGHLAPSFAAYILPQSIAPLLNVISQFGVILYMFLVGLELDISSLRGQARSTITISHASIVTPFILGSSLALLLYPQLSNKTVSFTSFSLFLGVSMSVTAFPVLARILTDRRIQKTRMGTLALACAAIDDVTAWCLLAFVVSVTQSHSGSAVRTILLAIAYVVVMFLLVRPLVVRMTGWVDGKGRISQGALACVLLGILFSSLTTESIGIHSIFGAFVLGAVIPHGSSLARELTSKLEDFVIVFLLPAFFAFTGLRTQIGLVDHPRQWMFCLLILTVASLGKFGGSFIAGRLTGLKWRDASALGVLMNTRGLMELIVLNIGLELHVISPTLFAMLVIMALSTTLATTPILHFIVPRGQLEGEAKEIEDVAQTELAQTSLAVRDRSGILVPFSNSRSVKELLNVASSLNPDDAPPPRVLALNRGTVTGAGPKLRETDTITLARSPLLIAALDAAWARGISITPDAVWTTDAASEIIEAAERAHVRWLLLESRRTMFGRYQTQGTVNRVLEKMATKPVNVAVLLQTGLFQPSSGVTCVVEGAKDGNAAVELALHLSQTEPSLRVLVVHPDPEADASVPPAWLRSAKYQGLVEIVPIANAPDVAAHIGDGRLVIGKDVVDRWNASFKQIEEQSSVIVVQGANRTGRKPDVAHASVETVTASAS